MEVEAEACTLCQVSRMAPQGSIAEKYLRSEGSGSRPHPGTPPQRTRSGASGPHQSGPARAPLSPYSSGGRSNHSSSSRVSMHMRLCSLESSLLPSFCVLPRCPQRFWPPHK